MTYSKNSQAVIKIEENKHKKSGIYTRKLSKKVVRSIEKANPLDTNINKDAVEETGMEAARLGYRTSKKAVKGVRLLYKTPKNTVNAVKGVIHITRMVIVQAGAFITNPLIYLFLFVFLMVYLFAAPSFLLLTGGTGAYNSNNAAYTFTGGTDEISTIYPDADKYFQTARDNKKQEWDNAIDAFAYDSNDLKHADLVFMVKNRTLTTYDRSIATDYQKSVLKNAWEFTMTTPEAVALVYVYLEKLENDANHTVGQIYDVEFTQEAFNDFVDMIVKWNPVTYGNQECPGKNCSIKVDTTRNPDYDNLKNIADVFDAAYWEWLDIVPFLETHDSIHDGNAQHQYWNNNISWRIDNFNNRYSSYTGWANTNNCGYDFWDYLADEWNVMNDQLSNMDEYIVTQTTTCETLHTLYSVSLNFYVKDEIMNAWGFDDTYRQWVDVTYKGLLINPDLNIQPAT